MAVPLPCSSMRPASPVAPPGLLGKRSCCRPPASQVSLACTSMAAVPSNSIRPANACCGQFMLLVADYTLLLPVLQVFACPIGGTLLPERWAIDGSGSTYIWGYCDSEYREDMSRQQAEEFVIEVRGRRH